MDLERFLHDRKKLIDDTLEQVTPGETTPPPTIHKAVRYSVFSGGKRIRPILTLASNELVGGDHRSIVPFACGIELIHTYSLIHDDLPAIDNSDFRRGKLSNHKVFGEAIAVLAGDALLTLAFQVMTDPFLFVSHDPATVLRAVHEISRVAGLQGMIGGQVVDVETEGKRFTPRCLEYIHTHKTGSLIAGAVKAGAILGGGGEREIEALTKYGENIGLAFQITDDILDVESTRKVLGKETGQDAVRGKATYPKLFGLEDSRNRAKELVEKAAAALGPFDVDRAESLRQIARHISQRLY
ncbi:MAG: polyprenyl synthetase family protein [Deltaproteobacteria bacterium]|nr:polyprenyl synthetase family protein [Deltaproteobacteria bacterium]